MGRGKEEGEVQAEGGKVEVREKMPGGEKKGRVLRGKKIPGSFNINAFVAKFKRKRKLRGNTTKIICHSPSVMRDKSPEDASESGSLSIPPRSQASPERLQINFKRTTLQSPARKRLTNSMSNNKGGFTGMVEKSPGPIEVFPLRNLPSLGSFPDISPPTEGMKILVQSPRSSLSIGKTKSIFKSNFVQAKNTSLPAVT